MLIKGNKWVFIDSWDVWSPKDGSVDGGLPADNRTADGYSSEELWYNFNIMLVLSVIDQASCAVRVTHNSQELIQLFLQIKTKMLQADMYNTC